MELILQGSRGRLGLEPSQPESGSIPGPTWRPCRRATSEPALPWVEGGSGPPLPSPPRERGTRRPGYEIWGYSVELGLPSSGQAVEPGGECPASPCPPVGSSDSAATPGEVVPTRVPGTQAGDGANRAEKALTSLLFS